MALRQLRGFACDWILGYLELAGTLYKLINETQQAQTDYLVWFPETQKTF